MQVLQQERPLGVCECHKKHEVAHLAQAEEREEPVLLMVVIAEVNATSSSSLSLTASPPTPVAPTQIHLDETNLFMQLGDT